MALTTGGAGFDAMAAEPARPTAGGAGPAAAASGPARTVAKVFEIAIREGKVDVADNRIVVAQGSDVELRWTSDRPVALHLHGYDIETRVAPDAPATISFRARLPGRFPVSEHRPGPSHHRAMLYLEVHP